MANAHRVVMKRDEDEDDELEPQQALPVPDGGYADISCDWKSHVPTTAEEYLRMVRQEASQVPDIVSKPMDSTMSRSTSKFHQLAAQFEDVAACPDEFVPSAEWEGCFLEYFSSVRETFVAVGATHRHSESKLPPSADQNQWLELCFRQKAQPPTLSQIAKTDSRTRGEILWTIATILKQNVNDPTLMEGHAGRLHPILSRFRSALPASYLRAAAARRVALRDSRGAGQTLGSRHHRRASLHCPEPLCSGCALSGSNCSYAVARSELEQCNVHQLPTLNVLITIIGSYFGQLEARSVPHAAEDEEWVEEEWEGEEEEEEGCEETGPQDVDLE
eukprot:188430-Rhodomonas_salina.1